MTYMRPSERIESFWTMQVTRLKLRLQRVKRARLANMYGRNLARPGGNATVGLPNIRN